MIRVYVAGAYSANNVTDVLGNMRRGMQLSYKVLKAGFAPFVPWFDYHFSLIGDVTLQEYYDYTLAWLRVSDAMILVPENLNQSIGTQNEITLAKELAIPIFTDLEELITYHKQGGLI